MSTVVIALVCFAVAFVAGAVLSKVYFSVHGAAGPVDAQLDQQRRRYRKRVDDLQNIIQRHEESQDEIRKKLEKFRAVTEARRGHAPHSTDETVEPPQSDEERNGQLSIRDTEIAALRERIEVERAQTEADRNQLGLLRIERDELLARIKRLESEQSTSDGGAADHAATDALAELRAEMGGMREKLATRDRRVHDLEQQLTDSDARVSDLTARLASWNDRVAPLTQKLRQQQALIRRYRERLSEPAGDEPLALDGATAQDQPTDDLKQIRGIGPALERRLHRHGIRSFEQIAELSAEELEDMAKRLAIAPNLVQRDKWVEQARALAEKQAEPA
jgi:predicted flap endonuclease-1-like 5' DNA nuclease